MAHPTAVIDEGAIIGEGTKIWHFSHVMSGAQIGSHCTLGQNVFVADKVKIGNHVKIQNNVSLYNGVTLEDNVFCGPSCVFTNVINPRAEIDRRGEYKKTLVMVGATIGANATLLCGNAIGRFAFVGAGCVITHDVKDYALMLGVPGKHVGWMGRHGYRLHQLSEKMWKCPHSGWQYEIVDSGLRCLDCDELQRP